MLWLSFSCWSILQTKSTVQNQSWTEDWFRPPIDEHPRWCGGISVEKEAHSQKLSHTCWRPSPLTTVELLQSKGSDGFY